MTPDGARRIELGDWQTPDTLAERVLCVAARAEVRSVLEPTCGEGSFLAAAALAFPTATLLGFDLSARYVSLAQARLGERATIERADFFRTDWRRVIASLPEPILIVGNPPWVTSAAVGRISGSNLPKRAPVAGHSGLDALTGKSNFDVSEWMIERLLDAAAGKAFRLAMLCKLSVARKVIASSHTRGRLISGSLRKIDARKYFGAAVDAVLLEVEASARPKNVWPLYASLTAPKATHKLSVIDGCIVNDIAAFHVTRALEGPSRFVWRSGVKHDCAAAMELDLETPARALSMDDFVYPLLKGSDLVLGRVPRKHVIVTQQKLGDETSIIRERAPRVWAHLVANSARLAARKSRIYQGQPPFAMFGIGDYTFAKFKVAISALHKQLTFRALGPIEGRPVMLDDTCYFVACSSKKEALRIARALNGPLAQRFFEARVFWDAKRPINKQLLSALSIERLLASEQAGVRHQRGD